MNVLVSLKRVERDEVLALREEYLDRLAFAQDAFVEALVADACFHTIHGRGKRLGYCAVSPSKPDPVDGTRGGGAVLLEFYLAEEAVYLAQSVFPKLIEQLELESALVKSFDDLALSCALDNQENVRVAGMLVRDYTPQQLPRLRRIRYATRIAREVDFDRVRALRQDVFTHSDRLLDVIRREQMLLFEDAEQLIAFGILRPVIEGRPDVEVGIAVDVPYRNKGYAAYILRDLVEFCLARGHNPVSGCSIENLASIRLGQRIGLCARHRLLHVTFGASA